MITYCFSAAEWNAYAKDSQEKILLQYRLTYLAESEVNWCPGLGTVLANEIVNEYLNEADLR
jgi:leucyl-tRNA synthetase